MDLRPTSVAGGAEAVTESPRTTSRPRATTPFVLQTLPLVPKPELMSSEAANALVARLAAYQPETETESEELGLVRKAYAIAYEMHEGQYRRSGEAYIDHPIAVAHILIDLKLDPRSVAAALLHDVIEDTRTSREQLEQCFNREIALLVDGVTKMTALESQTKEEVQAGTYRKMFLAMADNPRVVLVKLADRLHNMRTIEYMSAESQRRIARETMEIYAPLAHRVGIWQIKSELEDRSFAILNPDKFNEISRQLAVRREAREKIIQRVITRLIQALEHEGIKADVTGRPKHIYSIYRKMERKGVHLDQVYDQLAVRVIVGETRKGGGKGRGERNPWLDQYIGTCYQVLGIVHSLWPPVPGEFDDYIANPKESLYKSLHTTVLVPGGQPCEIQIRTQDMHMVAEFGIAAHWRYKEGFSRQDLPFEEKLQWLRRLNEWRSDVKDNREFVEWLKSEELKEQVHVFSPKGELIDLPLGSTPIDFAYRIHSQVGESCVGAKVNNKMVSLDYQLKSGEIVQIITSKTPRGPSRDWLNFVKTSGARTHIKRYFKRLRREENETAGRDLLEKELKRLGLSLAFEEIAQIWGYKAIEDLFAQIGSGDVTARQVAHKVLAQQIQAEQDLADLPQVAPQPERKTDPKGIQVRGVEGLPTRLARCCNPVITEPIVGFVTRGKGVTVHRADCRTIINERDRARLIDVSWGVPQQRQGYSVPVRIESWDRVGLWRDISGVVADAGINIEVVEQVPTRKYGRAVLRVILTIHSIAELTMILDKINRLPDVIEARREQSSASAA